MKVLGSYEKARLYIEKQEESTNDPGARIRLTNPGPCITMSRETGIGAEKICELLVEFLVDRSAPYYTNWAYFDKNLIGKILEDHALPSHFRSFLEQEKPSPSMASIFGDLMKSHPSSLKLLHNTTETILKLAKYGNAIIIGRGGNIITAELKNSFHVRLVAPVKFRVENAQNLYNMDKKEASRFIEDQDGARKEFLKTYFHKDIDDPRNYHIIINTYLMSFEEIAETIGHIIIKKYPYAFSRKVEYQKVL